MRTVCKENMCTGCMACVESCTKHAINIKDSLFAYNACIDEAKCINCKVCTNICQVNKKVEKRATISWHQGWSSDKDVRSKSSSGGAGTSLALGFVKSGGVVCSCTFNNGKFVFGFAENENEVEKFTGSKYVKSNPLGVYKEIKSILKNGEKVLFIGLPCQVAAVQKFVGEKLLESLYTVDLICHGSPSPELLNLFFQEYSMSLTNIKSISFRKKTRFKIFNDYKKVVPDSIQDSYTYAFLSSLDYTENCYSCQYACGERVGDITIGDAWGSELSQEEKGQGISLLLIQSSKGHELLEWSDMHLEPIDLKIATESNHQLMYPSKKHAKRELFFNIIGQGKGFNKAISKCCPEMFYKQQIKSALIKLGVIKIGGMSEIS